jgi:hypothetical protein
MSPKERKPRKEFREERGGVASREDAETYLQLVGGKMLAALWEVGMAMNVSVTEIVPPDTDYHFQGEKRSTKLGQHLIQIIATPEQKTELVETAKALIAASKQKHS